VLKTSAAVNLVGQCSGILPEYVAQFDGQSSYINVGNGNGLNANTAITVSVWVKINSLSDQMFVSKGLGTSITTFAYEIRVISGNPVFITGRADNTGYNLVTASAATTGTWYNLIGTFDGSSTKIYVNGVSTTAAGSNSIPIVANSVFIGERGFSSNYQVNGIIADVQIYNTALDGSQSNTLYLEGIGGAPVDPNHIVGWWPLNGDANDYSGNNNNGAPTAITYVSQYGK
jgi:hypothetical protein